LELPDLQEASLDWDAVHCVLADLDDFVTLVELQGRDAHGTIVALQEIPLALQQLQDGTVVALQIVYQFADQVWCDTLMREPQGARLLRMLSPLQAEESSP